MTGNDIQQALSSIGYSGLSDDQCTQLANNEKIAISQDDANTLSNNATAQPTADDGCKGTKILPLPGNCGLYIDWDDGPRIYVCCKFMNP